MIFLNRIHAVAGTGKSALIAQFIHNWNKTEIPIIAHFMSMGGDCRDISGVMRNIGMQLKNLNIILEPLEIEIKELTIQVRSALENLTTKAILIIDGIDEIKEF